MRFVPQARDGIMKMGSTDDDVKTRCFHTSSTHSSRFARMWAGGRLRGLKGPKFDCGLALLAASSKILIFTEAFGPQVGSYRIEERMRSSCCSSRSRGPSV